MSDIVGQVPYVQVAADGVGKKVAMEPQVDAYGNTVHLQKALIVGEPVDVLYQILDTQRQILACLRGIFKLQVDTSNSRLTEEDYSSQRGVNFDG